MKENETVISFFFSDNQLFFWEESSLQGILQWILFKTFGKLESRRECLECPNSKFIQWLKLSPFQKQKCDDFEISASKMLFLQVIKFTKTQIWAKTTFWLRLKNRFLLDTLYKIEDWPSSGRRMNTHFALLASWSSFDDSSGFRILCKCGCSAISRVFRAKILDCWKWALNLASTYSTADSYLLGPV